METVVLIAAFVDGLRKFGRGIRVVGAQTRELKVEYILSGEVMEI